MPTITAQTLAQHLPQSGSFYKATHSIHSVFRGDQRWLAGNYWIKASRIPRGTPTTIPTCPYNYSIKSWTVRGVETREDGKVLIHLENKGKGTSWSYYSVTLVMDPTDTIYISRLQRW